LNWAVQSAGASKPLPQTVPQMAYPGASSSGDFSVYVGDLDPNVTDSILLETFTSRFKSVLSASVIVDPITKRSKKYGFVRFGTNEDSQNAIFEMNGKYVLSRPIKLNVGFKKAQVQQTGPGPGQAPGYPSYPSYGQQPAPTYPPPAYPSYGQDPYQQKPSYGGYGGGYGGYGGYGGGDPYSQPNQQQYNYGGYQQYPQPAGGYGGAPGGAQQYPPAASGYDYGQQAQYPSYDKGYSDPSMGQSYAPPVSNAPEAPAGYNNYYGYGGPEAASQNPNANYYGQPAYQDPVQETVPEPVQPVKEVDYDLGESTITPLFDIGTTQNENQKYYEHMLSTQGKIDLL
jgi:hypothetical protein